MEHIREELVDAACNYTPNSDTAAALANKFIVPIIGPTAVGKSTLMEEACHWENDFARTRSFTTRPQRVGESDDTYTFLPHDEPHLKEILLEAQIGSLVQIAPHPTTEFIYGSKVADYPSKYNLLDVLSSEMSNIRRLPFAHCIPITISVEPEVWHTWFLDRFTQTQDLTDAQKRLREAKQSLDWSLQDPQTMWLQNIPNDSASSACELIDMADGRGESSGIARNLGRQMRQSIPTLSKMLLELAT